MPATLKNMFIGIKSEIKSHKNPQQIIILKKIAISITYANEQNNILLIQKTTLMHLIYLK